MLLRFAAFLFGLTLGFVQADPVEVLKAETYQKCFINMRLVPGVLPVPEKG